MQLRGGTCIQSKVLTGVHKILEDLLLKVALGGGGGGILDGSRFVSAVLKANDHGEKGKKG